MNLNKRRTKFTVFVGILFVLFMQVWPKSNGGFLLVHTWFPAQLF